MIGFRNVTPCQHDLAPSQSLESRGRETGKQTAAVGGPLAEALQGKRLAPQQAQQVQQVQRLLGALTQAQVPAAPPAVPPPPGTSNSPSRRGQ